MAKESLNDTDLVNVRLTALSGGVTIRDVRLKWGECFAYSLNRGDYIHITDDSKEFCIEISNKIVYAGKHGSTSIHFIGAPVRDNPLLAILGDR